MKNWFVVISIILFVVCLDQVTKSMARAHLEEGERVRVLGNVLSFTLTGNSGVAFGMMPGSGKVLAAAVSFAVLASIFFFLPGLIGNAAARTGSALLAGGIAGNLIDRLSRGSVTDFIDMRIWPVFNAGDIAICAGTGILLLFLFRHDKKPARPAFKERG